MTPIYVTFLSKQNYRDRNHLLWPGLWGSGRRRDTRNTFGVVEIFHIFTVVVVTWLHIFVKSHSTTYLEDFVLNINCTSKSLAFFLKKEKLKGKNNGNKKLSLQVL